MFGLKLNHVSKKGNWWNFDGKVFNFVASAVPGDGPTLLGVKISRGTVMAKFGFHKMRGRHRSVIDGDNLRRDVYETLYA